MKKPIAILLVLLLALSFLTACQGKKTTSEPQSPTTPEEGSVLDIVPSPSASDPSEEKSSLSPLPENVDISAKKEGSSVAVRLSLPDAAGKEVSLVILTDLSYRYSWAEHQEALCDLAQVRLDDKGEGTLTMQLNNENDPFYLIVTAADGTAFTLPI